MSAVYLLGLAIGLYMIWGGATKATSKPYFFLHARASLLWKDRAHQFLLISGILVVTVMAYLSLNG
ncbi:MAG: hypothetical protein DCO81_05030 [Candidatus Aquiluna sp. XM-24bin5]|nr:MAG: hypothetical protein DCO81_05030 [Candidatus Aquiluna sp. XM-24bin5]